jgi:YVTN family beta-propeller protein
LLLGGIILARADTSRPAGAETKPRPRRPVALVLADKDTLLFVANQGGTVAVIDVKNQKLISEVAIGRRLADLAATPDGAHLLAADEGANQLVVLSRRGAELAVVHRLRVNPTPVSVRAGADGKRCYVASLWARQVAVVDLGLGKGEKPRVTKTIDLPFAPRCQLPVGDKLIVADSFGGKVGLVDLKKGRLESVRAVPGHNIRGLALANGGKRLLLTHQVLHEHTQSTEDDVHWGNLMTNNLRALDLAKVLAADADLLDGGDLRYLGAFRKGLGDPAGLAVVAGGTVVVTGAGTNEVTLGGQGAEGWERLAVGRRPTAVVAGADGGRAYVANTFGDSVTVVDVKSRKIEAEISLGKPGRLSEVERGEELFFDARLSHDGWFSCQSCHTDGHTNGLLNDNLSDGTLGTPKRVLTLLGVKDTGPWAWDGSMPDLETQTRQSIQSTMQGKKPPEEQVRAIVAYLRTLPPPPGVDAARGRVDRAAVRRGREVFRAQGCAGCHAPPVYTSPKTFDVGLQDEAGKRLFNPPSLRGVSQGGPYFHDNRAATLEDVFARHRHQLKKELARHELRDLLAFLRSL